MLAEPVVGLMRSGPGELTSAPAKTLPAPHEFLYCLPATDTTDQSSIHLVRPPVLKVRNLLEKQPTQRSSQHWLHRLMRISAGFETTRTTS